MFPVLTASSITLTLPVEDSHTGHNCFSMGLGSGRGAGREAGGEGECVRFSLSVCICMLAAQASAAPRIKDTAPPGPVLADSHLSKSSCNLSHRS